VDLNESVTRFGQEFRTVLEDENVGNRLVEDLLTRLKGDSAVAEPSQILRGGQNMKNIYLTHLFLVRDLDTILNKSSLDTKKKIKIN